MKKLITALLTAAVMAGTILSVSAADDAKGKKPAKKESAKKSDKKTRDTYPYRGIIGKVGKDSITLKQKSGDRTIAVSDDAKVTIDGKKGKLSDIKTGDYVTGSVKKTDGKEVAVSVYKKDKPEPKKKPSKKKSADDGK